MFFFFSSRRRHTRLQGDWSSDVCSSDLTRGILAHLNSEAELGGVVGHEIGHVTARHSVSQLSKQQLAQLGLAVGSIASPEFGRYAGLAGQALGVLFLKYSRDNESQADDLGLALEL